MESLEIFYQSFDINNDSKLQWKEAGMFFNWVKRNVQYRFDDENYPYETQYLVGDGIEGRDYHQSPFQTYYELAGDCEDHAKLVSDFFDYWGYESKPGVLKFYDGTYHSVALVKIDNPVDVASNFGKLSVYTISKKDRWFFDLSPGKYMIIDTLYGTRIGNLVTPSDSPPNILLHTLEIK